MIARTLLSICSAALFTMLLCVQSSISYAQTHSHAGMHWRATYLITIESRTVGVISGEGDGDEGTLKDTINKLVSNIVQYKAQDAYKKLSSMKGLRVTLQDVSVGVDTHFHLWLNAKTNELTIVYEQ